MLTDDQLRAMEAGAPLLVAEYRKLQRVYELVQEELHNALGAARSIRDKAEHLSNCLSLTLDDEADGG